MRKLNFKKWLKKQGIDVKLFWKNCKRENQRWGLKTPHKRKELKYLEPEHWVSQAFSWKSALDSKSYIFYNYLNKKWIGKVEEAEKNNIKIKFGFKE